VVNQRIWPTNDQGLE